MTAESFKKSRIIYRVPQINRDFDYDGWKGGWEESHILSLIDGKSSILDICDKSSFDMDKSLRLIQEFIKQKLVFIVDEDEQAPVEPEISGDGTLTDSHFNLVLKLQLIGVHDR